MVLAYPNLRRKFINTDGLVKANRSELVSELYERYPQDYVDIKTHNTIQKTIPWAELPSPIARKMLGMSRQKSLQPFIKDKILVLCVDFPDKPASLPIEKLYDRFFGEFTNSLKMYYKEVSYSRYLPHGEIFGWYRVPNPSTFYTNQENGFGKYPNSADRLIEDVIDIASKDPDIDWTSFDQNDNGYIDNLIVIHSGAEASWTGNVDDFWAHVYVIPEPKMIQGRYVWVYALVSEYLDIPENYRLVGIDSHEHGHQLGLPDLYDYSDNSNGVGLYSLMGGGSWALKGSSGVHLDAWSKYILGFTDTIENPTGRIYLDNAELGPNNIKYTTTDPKEFYLLENRQKILYDTYLPSEGLFIWHINENQQYNDNEACYLVGLIQADGLKDLENRANSGDLGDPYPGILNNRSFGPSSNPPSVLCDGSILDILISNISDSDRTMTFNSSIGKR